jgi:hypothetical protein
MQLSIIFSTAYSGSLLMIMGLGGGSYWPGIGSPPIGSNKETWNTGYTFIMGGSLSL